MGITSTLVSYGLITRRPFRRLLHCCRSRVDDLGAECFLQASHWPRSWATEPILRDGVFDRVLPSHAATVRARLHPGIVCSTFCQSASNLHAFPARETQTLPHTHSLARSRSLTPNRPLTKFYPFFTWGFPQGFQWSPGRIRSRSDQLDRRQLARCTKECREIQLPAHGHWDPAPSAACRQSAGFCPPRGTLAS